MKAKRYGILLLVMVLALSLFAGCEGNTDAGSSGAGADSGGASQSNASEAQNGDEPSGEKVWQVGFVTDMGIDQAEWLQNCVAGLNEYAAANDNVEIKVVESTDVREFEPKIRALAETGCDIIITMESSMAEATVSVANDYPNIMFGSLDGTIENIEQYENIQEFGLNRTETGFIAGVTAAASTQTNKVGIVAGADEPVINAIVAGWQQGIQYVNPDIEDIVVYANTFTDPTTGKELGLSLADRGCDVIGAAAGGTGVGSAQAAAEAGIYFVAWDTHYPEVFTEEQLELGSALNFFDIMFIEFIEAAISGDYKGGTVTEHGMSGGVCQFQSPEGAPVTAEAQAIMDEATEKVRNGEIIISTEPLHK